MSRRITLDPFDNHYLYYTWVTTNDKVHIVSSFLDISKSCILCTVKVSPQQRIFFSSSEWSINKIQLKCSRTFLRCIPFSFSSYTNFVNDLFLDFILTSQDHVASSLRLIQVFTDVKSYAADDGQNIVNKIYRYLISQKYYEKIRALADARWAYEHFFSVQLGFSAKRSLF